MRTHILLFFSTLLWSVSFAQEADYKIFTLKEENESPQILTLFQNKQGYILAGTTLGLYRFDGLNFFKYAQDKHLSGPITALAENNGQLWVGFQNGQLGLLNKNKIELLHHTNKQPRAAINKMMADTNGVLWIATAGEGLYYYTPDGFHHIDTSSGLSDNFVYDIIEKPGTGIITGTDRGVNICKLENNLIKIDYYTSRDGLPDNIVRSIAAGNDSLYWLGMQEAGLGSYSYKRDKFQEYNEWKYGQINGIINSLSDTWIATEENGLIGINASSPSGDISIIHKNDALKKVSSLIQDKEGNIWAAGHNQLMRTVGSKLQPFYRFSSPAPEDLHALLFSKKNTIWFNKNHKLIRLTQLQNESWKEDVYSFKFPGKPAVISSLYQDNTGYLWVGTMGAGVFLFDPKTGAFRKIKEEPLLLNGSILSISGKGNKVWLATLNGAIGCEHPAESYNLDHPLKFIHFDKKHGPGNSFVYSIFADSKKRLWFATDGKGIILLDHNKYTSYLPPLKKNEGVVYKILEDQLGNIWFSTLNNGIYKYDGKQFQNYNLADGLSDREITSLAVSGSQLFIVHKKGIDILNIFNGAITYIDAEQGISNINSDLNTITTDKEGNIYFVDGYQLYRYQPLFQLQQRPAIVIDQVQLFLKDIDKPGGYKFDVDENNISFSFSGLFYSNPEKVLYQYKLEGYDESWITTRDRFKNFPNLPAGAYTFRVRAALNKNFTNNSEATYNFIIKQPFYTTYWFISLCFLAASFILMMLIRGREENLKRYSTLENEKIQSQFETLRNQVNPHFLFNSFNTLISEIEENPEKAVKYVEHLSDFYRNIVVHREKDVISLEEELSIMNDYFYIQQKRYGNAFITNIYISEQDAGTFFVAPLTLQLLAENAIKHNAVSIETPLFLEMFIEDNNYLVVKNNINPKMQREKGSNLGLQNIQKRYSILTGLPVIIETTFVSFIVKVPLIRMYT